MDGSSIHIINVTRQTGTTNSASGEFEILVAVNDVLKFSSVQFKTAEVKISEELFQLEFLEVGLEENLNELGVVNISNINLSGNLEQDLEQMEVFSQANVGFAFSRKPAQTLMSRKFNSSKNSPLILLINALNGRIKMLKKAREYVEFFVAELRIPEVEIGNFVYFCAERPDYSKIISSGKHLDLLEIYCRNAPIFLKQLK